MNHFRLSPTLIKTLLFIGIAVALVGCASSDLQWWRVGNCLVLYEERDETRQIVVAGEQCDIKRQEMPRGHGMARSPWR
ncbi:MAG: hypothetical protein ACREKS_18500 [Candidatus Rokuibacteriota bacterium]